MFLEVFLLVAFFNLNSVVHCVQSKEVLYQKKFPPCKACKVFIDSFKKGIEQTAKGKFDGGDTAWEEEKLGSYANSEIRLTEIQENICTDIVEGRDQCYSIHEEYDDVLEEWWFQKQNDDPDIFKYFCIDQIKSCCPEYHFGENCTPCEGFPDNICSKNGKCKGAGTRKGNGKCLCDTGYANDKCDNCAEGYFQSPKDDNKLTCSKCHSSCDGPCTKAGATGCTKCRDGWIMDDNDGCIDVDECTSSKSPCKTGKFCVNNIGSYQCLFCDRSCQSCTGDGPDMCDKCAEGYIMKHKRCVDAEEESRKQYLNFTRYLFYIGLCIATYIVFKKNIVLAAIIGAAVSIYVIMSEYLDPHANPRDIALIQKIPG
ncbi:cysteine-rich with EGF-like domain protein 2 [Harmonia axyridis]|uniref:cysteine-rich with EGF-like domain protein 2 n=1 Tax=Harmonia axyridis TaxID=115357 RepID=UPI001E2796B9|nr:cysteine-rich with EGF-like domain protein 2 [Harmonia axyridis]